MKDTKVIDAMIEDTLETVRSHSFSMVWLEERLYNIIYMAEDVKRIWMEDEVVQASSDVNSPTNTKSLESLILERISKPIFGRK